MELGKAYLVHCGDWHTFVGRVSRQVGPLTYEMESASKIASTRNGDCWHRLAAGDEALRRACEYHHHGGPILVVLSIAALPWAGRTPLEAGL